MRHLFVAWIAWLPAVLSASPVMAAEAGEKYLLLDGRIIERVENAALRVGTVRKHPANPLFGEEHPWEARFDNLYPNVLFDEEGLYRIWHKTFTRDAVTEDGKPVPREERIRGTYGRFPRKRGDGLCYAVSRDGLAWEKPLLELHPWKGAPSNLVAVGNHGVGVHRDPYEEDPGRRYKMFLRARDMGVRFSPDGLHWGDFIARPQIAAPGDTHNEIRLYYGASNGPHTDWRDGFLALATLRPDGFAGYEPEKASEPAVVVTRPVTCVGRTLTITCDARGGSVVVAVVDEAGEVLARGQPITDDATDAEVRWQRADGLEPFVGKPIRLRFEIRGAKVYAFGMSP